MVQEKMYAVQTWKAKGLKYDLFHWRKQRLAVATGDPKSTAYIIEKGRYLDV